MTWVIHTLMHVDRKQPTHLEQGRLAVAAKLRVEVDSSSSSGVEHFLLPTDTHCSISTPNH